MTGLNANHPGWRTCFSQWWTDLYKWLKQAPKPWWSRACVCEPLDLGEEARHPLGAYDAGA